MGVDSVKQPIIRGIQAVGSVSVQYRYNKPKGTSTSLADGWELPVPRSFKLYKQDGSGSSVAVSTITGASVEITGDDGTTLAVSKGFIPVAGFRLDSEFLRANPQIASSFVIPLLGGGGLALTNNNRTGTLNLVCTKVSTPGDSFEMKQAAGATLGVESGDTCYDMVTLAQIQQGQEAGDSYGATILIAFNFCGDTTVLEFQGCTIANVDPIGLAGNDAANYAIAINYLNWKVQYNATTVSTVE